MERITEEERGYKKDLDELYRYGIKWIGELEADYKRKVEERDRYEKERDRYEKFFRDVEAAAVNMRKDGE